MNVFLTVMIFVGVTLAVGIIVNHDAGAILSSVATLGWALPVIIAVHGLPVVVSAFAWRLLAEPGNRSGYITYVGARVLREGVNDLLPTAQVGGPAAGASLLVSRGTPLIPATASAIVDFTIEVASQLLFTLLGIALLAALGRAPAYVTWAALGLTVMAFGVGGFVFAQRHGLVRLGGAALGRLIRATGGDSRIDAEVLHEAVWQLYQRRSLIALSFMFHSIGWCLGAIEVWLTFAVLGHPVSPAEALILESLGQGIRSAAFFMPAGLGVQEGGYVVLGAALGVPPHLCLALSLTKRVREIALGGTALILWQLLMSRRLLTNRSLGG